MIHLFGASTPTGEALRNLAQQDLVGYSRKVSTEVGWLHPADLKEPSLFHPPGSPSDSALWISLAPIWLFSSFLEQLAKLHPERLHNICGVIACSSSSCITKRFASNSFDRQLVIKLIAAEDQLISTCQKLSVPCRILRPTLIYGQAGDLHDRNLSRLTNLMRRLPLLVLPMESGLRQPIHVRQLAAVVLHLADQAASSGWNPALPERIAIGGDTTLTYAQMISTLQRVQPYGDPARHCRLLLIPNRLFFLLASPLLLFSPKAFEAVLRMGANLSGFTPAHEFLGSKAVPFPVLPVAR